MQEGGTYKIQTSYSAISLDFFPSFFLLMPAISSGLSVEIGLTELHHLRELRKKIKLLDSGHSKLRIHAGRSHKETKRKLSLILTTHLLSLNFNKARVC